MEQEQNPIECLLDETNSDPIILYDENDKAVKFEQVALIPFEDDLYALLKPIDKIDGVEDDEAVVFKFEEDESGAPILTVVIEDKLIDDVFKIYLDMVNEEKEKLEKNTDKSSEKKTKKTDKTKKSK